MIEPVGFPTEKGGERSSKWPEGCFVSVFLGNLFRVVRTIRWGALSVLFVGMSESWNGIGKLDVRGGGGGGGGECSGT